MTGSYSEQSGVLVLSSIIRLLALCVTHHRESASNKGALPFFSASGQMHRFVSCPPNVTKDVAVGHSSVREVQQGSHDVMCCFVAVERLTALLGFI